MTTYSLEEIRTIISSSNYRLSNETIERITDVFNSIQETINNPAAARNRRGGGGGGSHFGTRYNHVSSVSPTSRPTYSWKALDTDTEAKFIAQIKTILNKITDLTFDKLSTEICTHMSDKTDELYNKIIDLIYSKILEDGFMGNTMQIFIKILEKLKSQRPTTERHIDDKAREWLSYLQKPIENDIDVDSPEFEVIVKQKKHTRIYCKFVANCVASGLVNSRAISDYIDTIISNITSHQHEYEMKQFNSFRLECLCIITEALGDSDFTWLTRLHNRLIEIYNVQHSLNKSSSPLNFNMATYYIIENISKFIQEIGLKKASTSETKKPTPAPVPATSERVVIAKSAPIAPWANMKKAEPISDSASSRVNPAPVSSTITSAASAYLSRSEASDRRRYTTKEDVSGGKPATGRKQVHETSGGRRPASKKDSLPDDSSSGWTEVANSKPGVWRTFK